ncbi:MAG: hypothetical protein ABJM82_16890 [Shimia thalassica]|uniref:hypothetical protein n=1 Tax=Shimia thalassica TaxID=1715693 RepID=UPI00329728F4
MATRGRKKANWHDRQAELVEISRMEVAPPQGVELDERELVMFEIITSHRSAVDWSGYEIRQVAELARLEVLSEELWAAVKLIGATTTPKGKSVGGPSAELRAYSYNHDIILKMRRFLKLTTVSAPHVLHAEARHVRRAGVVTAHIIEADKVDEDDVSLLAD